MPLIYGEEQTPKPQLRRLPMLIATWFGCGYSPFAPGTCGSVGALLPAWFLARAGWHPLYLLLLAAAVLPVSVWAADAAAKDTGSKDPGLVVIDEVVGQWITLAGAATFAWPNWLAAFALFRLMDIWKPFPIRRLEHLPGGYGIMADDVLAGVYGAVALFALGSLHLY